MEFGLHGNMIKMHHLQLMQYDYQDNLKEVDLDLAGNKAYYVYDANGERVRKVVIKSGIVENRFYIGDYELYTKTGTGYAERTTLHINDDKQKVALIDFDEVNSTKTVRYQLTNHLGSASVELNETGEIISYEEYRPFGTTSYRSGRSEVEVSLKRYKYVFKELDNETGLYYYGMRYYASWIARFISVDPLQFEYPIYTPFQYAGNKPISYIDLDGAEEDFPHSMKRPTQGQLNSYYQSMATFAPKNISQKKPQELAKFYVVTMSSPSSEGTSYTSGRDLSKWTNGKLEHIRLKGNTDSDIDALIDKLSEANDTKYGIAFLAILPPHGSFTSIGGGFKIGGDEASIYVDELHKFNDLKFMREGLTYCSACNVNRDYILNYSGKNRTTTSFMKVLSMFTGQNSVGSTDRSDADWNRPNKTVDYKTFKMYDYLEVNYMGSEVKSHGNKIDFITLFNMAYNKVQEMEKSESLMKKYDVTIPMQKIFVTTPQQVIIK